MQAAAHPPRPEVWRDDSKATIETLDTLAAERISTPWWRRERVRMAVLCWVLAQLGWVEASVGPLIRASRTSLADDR